MTFHIFSSNKHSKKINCGYGKMFFWSLGIHSIFKIKEPTSCSGINLKRDPLTKRVDLLASLFQFLLTSAKMVSGLYNTHGSHDKSNVIINQHLSSRHISGESFNFIVWNSRGRDGGRREGGGVPW